MEDVELDDYIDDDYIEDSSYQVSLNCFSRGRVAKSI